MQLWTRKHSPTTKMLALALVLLVLFFIHLFIQAMTITKEGIWVSHAYLWSDWALHLAITNQFLEQGRDAFSFHPVSGLYPLNYGFFTHLVSSVLVRLGLSLESSFAWVGSFFLVGFCTVFVIAVRNLTNHLSVGLLALLLWFFGAGLEGFPAIWNALSHGGELTFYEVTKNRIWNWGNGNFFVGFLFPQRAFLPGLFFAWIGIWAFVRLSLHVVQAPHKRGLGKWGLITIAVISFSLLPLTHMHSLLATFFLFSPLFFAELMHAHKRKLLVPAFFLSSFGVILVGTLYLWSGLDERAFFVFDPEFRNRDFLTWVGSWLMRFGWMLPLGGGLAIAYFLRGGIVEKRIGFLGVGALLLFGFANLWLVQPTRWDNSKLTFWAYGILSIVVAHFLRELWREEWRLPKWFSRILAPALILVLCLSGGMELFALKDAHPTRYQLLTRQELQMGEWIRENTKKDALFLTAPTHRSLVSVVAARRIFLGYAGWAANFGFPVGILKRRIEVFFQNPDREGIDYVLVDRAFAAEYPRSLSTLEESLNLVHQVGSIRLFSLR